MSEPKEERLKQCYRIANAFVRSEHSSLVSWSQECKAALSISASILACKLFDLDIGHLEPEEAEPSRADLLDFSRADRDVLRS